MNDPLYGNLFNSLPEEQKAELIISYEESFDENNLLSHQLVKLQHKKWFDALRGGAAE